MSSSHTRDGRDAERSAVPPPIDHMVAIQPARRPTDGSAHVVIESAAVGQPAYACSLPRRPESAEAARHLVSSALDTWGLPELTDDARQVVTELVSNTVAHARRDTIRVTVTRLHEFLVELSVTDLSVALPEIRPADPDDESGRGLAIVAALTGGRWGAERRRWGKRVWAQLVAPEARGAGA